MSRVVVNEIEAKVGNDISFNDTVKIDTIKGKTTAGSVTVQGEGTATTNLQQGLAKVWVNYDSTASSDYIRDSFNVSSNTDNNTGSHDIFFSNNTASVNYAGVTNGHRDDNQAISILQTSDNSTSNFRYKLNAHTSGTNTDTDSAFGAIYGDLA
tara:strand:- start:56 stop:517 length:462 start_codon:yes stop_codon:yes gene_type:complete